jgi:hypothetical protein
MAAASLPRRLLEGFVRVEGLLAERYQQALAEIGAGRTDLRAFHVDAAGYSPEIALERRDPHYLGQGPFEPHAVLVCLEQLSAPLVHPGLAYARNAHLEAIASARAGIAAVLQHDALILDVDPGSALPSRPHELADLKHFELAFRTPRGLVRGTQRLEQMKSEFLASDRLWLDDEFIREMTDLARELRNVGSQPRSLAGSSHAFQQFHCPAFGGAYVFEEGARNTIHVLCADTKQPQKHERGLRERKVREHPLDAGHALRLLSEHRVVRFDPEALRSSPGPLDSALYWIAVEHLHTQDPDRSLEAWSPRDLERAMAAEPDPPRAHLELAEVRRRVEAGRRSIDLSELAPASQLRLLTPSSRRPAIRRFVLHLQAFLDPLDLGRWWRDAPDVFFGRLHTLSPERVGQFAAWLESTDAA